MSQEAVHHDAVTGPSHSCQRQHDDVCSEKQSRSCSRLPINCAEYDAIRKSGKASGRCSRAAADREDIERVVEIVCIEHEVVWADFLRTRTSNTMLTAGATVVEHLSKPSREKSAEPEGVQSQK